MPRKPAVPDMSLIGKVIFGGSVVIEYAQTTQHNFNKWKLRCVCGTEFYALYKNFNIPNKKCVCHSCKMKSETLEGRRFGRWTVLLETAYKKNSIRFYECVCDCGTMRLVNSSTLIQGKSKSCGCLHKELVSERAKKQSGENHYRWKGGIRKSKNFRKNSNFRFHLRKYIIKRDNNQCILCGNNQKLKVHHLDGWNICKARRFDETNLVTLCEICHNDFHRVFGKGNNTEQQFELYCFDKYIDLNKIVEFMINYKNINDFNKNFEFLYYKFKIPLVK